MTTTLAILAIILAAFLGGFASTTAMLIAGTLILRRHIRTKIIAFRKNPAASVRNAVTRSRMN